MAKPAAPHIRQRTSGTMSNSGSSSETLISQMSEWTAPLMVMEWPIISAWSTSDQAVTGVDQVMVLTHALRPGLSAIGCNRPFRPAAMAMMAQYGR